jgi:hypothetical protein
MPEPNSTTIGILAGTGIGLTGTVMGAQVDALLMGMIAAVFVSIWLPSINDRLRAASAVGISSLLAGTCRMAGRRTAQPTISYQLRRVHLP